MKRVIAAALLVLPAILLSAQAPSSQAAQNLTGRWLLTSDFFGTTRYFRLDLEQNAQQLTSTFGGTKLQGTLTGDHLAMTGTGSDGGATTIDATSAAAVPLALSTSARPSWRGRILPAPASVRRR